MKPVSANMNIFDKKSIFDAPKASAGDALKSAALKESGKDFEVNLEQQITELGARPETTENVDINSDAQNMADEAMLNEAIAAALLSQVPAQVPVQEQGGAPAAEEAVTAPQEVGARSEAANSSEFAKWAALGGAAPLAKAPIDGKAQPRPEISASKDSKPLSKEALGLSALGLEKLRNPAAAMQQSAASTQAATPAADPAMSKMMADMGVQIQSQSAAPASASAAAPASASAAAASAPLIMLSGGRDDPSTSESSGAREESSVSKLGLSGDDYIKTMSELQAKKAKAVQQPLNTATASMNDPVAPPGTYNPANIPTGSTSQNLKAGKSLSSMAEPLQMGQINPGASIGTGVFAQYGARDAIARKVDVTGYVVPGAMAKNRLSSESLMNISNGIGSLKNSGGGEIKIKLNPETLGELQVRVRTVGDQVGIQIQPSNPTAKKVIEESLGYLKDNLAGHNLQLARVEFVHAPQRADDGMNMNRDSQQQQAFNQAQSDFNNFMGANSQSRNRDAYLDQDNGAGPGMVNNRSSGRNSSGLAGVASANSARSANGRLDVIA